MTDLAPTKALLAHISDCQTEAVMLHGLCQGAECLFNNISTEVSPEANAITPLLAAIARSASDLARQLDSTIAERIAEGRA